MRKVFWAAEFLGLFLLLGLGFMGCVEWGDAIAALPPETAHAADSGTGTLHVGVLGDAQKGLANLSRICHAVNQEGVGFMIQTGDLVSRNDWGHYRLAMRYLSKGGVDKWPFITPGNHDIKGGTELFQRTIGELERSFTVKSVAFVLVDNAFGNPIPDPRHLEERIAAAGPHAAVVLAMHQPPVDIQGNPKPGYGPFLAWLEQSKVAYLLCGHEHGYLRKTIGKTTLIINGAGGDYDSWQLDQKVFATILDIDGDRISDRKIEIEPVHEVWENVEHLAIGHVAEAYRHHPVWCWLGTVLLLKLTGLGWFRLVRRPGIPKAA